MLPLVAAALIATSCGSDDSSGSGDAQATTTEAPSTEAPSTEAPAPAEPIAFTIGELTILEGPLSDGVITHRNALQMAVDDLNAQGLVDITVVTGNVGSTPDEALGGYASIAGEDLLAVVGAPLSPQTNAIAGELADAGIIQLAPNAIPVKDFSPLAFNVFPPYLAYQLPPALDSFYELHGDELESAFYVSSGDYPVGIAVNETRRDFLEAQGVETVGEESVLQTDTDFLTLATKIAAENPSVVLEDTLSSIALIRQLRDAGYDGLIFGGAYVANANFLVPSQGAFEGAYGWAAWLPAPTDNLTELGRDFVKRYEARFGSSPDAFGAGIYDGVLLLAAAVVQVGAADDPAAIADAMSTITLPEGVTSSPLAFDENRTLPMDPLLMRIEGTTQVAVG
ncbi:MAG: ABC transporter substrate-binding protein [Acidimicrobiales bacterium]|nr:ABC transporter substrate-binding protein [Acidimicrobiales bacterium]